jgi:hypothetical protein
MNPLTLLYSGTEKWLGNLAGQPSWGFENPVMVYRSRAASTFTVRAPAALPEAAFPIPADGVVAIYDGRAFSGGTFSGGQIIFTGRLTSLDGQADPSAPAVQATFSDVWFDLQYTPFQHLWQQWNGSSVSTAYYSRINLFQDISAGPGGSWGYLTTLQQLQEILAFAQSNCSLNVQYGKIDPAWNQPFYPCRAVSCAEAVMLCLRPIPDAVTFMDYTATPPKLHIRQRVALATAAGTPSDPGGPVTLPYRDGVKHKSSRVRPRPDLQCSQVVVQYQSVANVGGVNYVETSLDVFPPGSAGNAYKAIVVPIDLRGGSRTYVSATLTADAAAPSTAAWWVKKKPELAETDDSGNALITGLAVDSSSIKVVQEDGTDITSTWAANWPNELRPGPGVAAWMYDGGGSQIVARDVTITAKVSYTRQVSHANTNALHKAEVHTISCRVRLTNSAAGAVTYTAVSHTEAGEPAVSNLAVNIYNSIGAPTVVSGVNYGAPPAWEGTHTIVENTISNYYTPGNLLNLSGGASAWATMNAQIYSVEYDFFRGATTIEFGPHRHLTTEEFFQLIMQFRTRLVWDNPQVRNTGQDSTGSNVEMAADNAKENSTEALPQQSIHSVMSAPDGSNHQWMVQHDMTTPQTIMQQVDSGGSPVSGAIQIRLKPADISTLGLTNTVAFFQKIFVCKTDSSGNIITDGSGNPIKQKAAFLCTTPE